MLLSSYYQGYLDYPRITVYHNSCCHYVVTKIGWCRTNLYRYYSAVFFELQYRLSKITRNIFKKRAKHIDFLERWYYNINTHNANIACRKLVTG
mgnify:FL=1